MNNKGRDYMFDAFRGILMLSIPISHFTRMGVSQYASIYMYGGFPKTTFGGFIYITINVFVMQAFMFLSGYFSKNTDRARETSFKTFMWPYLVFTLIYWFVRMFFYGEAHLSFLNPPFALWFLFSLFFYRFLLKDAVKFRWLFPLSIVLYFVAGHVSEWGSFLALGRTMSYFVFFLIGYYCSKERLRWLQGLKKHKVLLALLGTGLVFVSIGLTQLRKIPVEWYLLRESYHSYPEMMWYDDVLMRLLLLIVSFLWIVFAVNVIPNKKTFLVHVGTNTMPVYMFHLALRYVIPFYGVYMCALASLVTAWFAILSLVYKKITNKIAYAVSIIVSICGITALFGSGILSSIYNLCPENKILFYVILLGSALLCGVSFTAPFWVSLYNTLVDGPMALKPVISSWLCASKLKVEVPESRTPTEIKGISEQKNSSKDL